MIKRFREIIQWCGRCAVVFVSALTAVILIGRIVGPESAWLIALLQYVYHIFVLIPALLAVPLSFTLWRSWKVASTCSLAVIVIIVMGLELNVGDPQSRRMRLMTYNVKGYLAMNGPEGMALIGREIIRHDADIVVLQDASELTAMLITKPGMGQKLFASRHMYTYGQYLVASRYPLLDCGPRSISFRAHPHTYVRCVVNFEGTEIDLFTVHLVTPRDGLNAIRQEQLHGISEWKQNISDRMIQAKSLVAALRARQRPVIVAGDFNAPMHSMVVQGLLDTGLRNAFSTSGTGFGYTYGHSLWPGISFVGIDHVLVSLEIGIADCFVGGERGSTHRPVIADLAMVTNR